MGRYVKTGGGSEQLQNPLLFNGSLALLFPGGIAEEAVVEEHMLKTLLVEEAGGCLHALQVVRLVVGVVGE